MEIKQLSIYFKINLLFTSLLSLLFLFFNSHYDIVSFIFTAFALVSTVSTLYLIYFILLRLFFRFTGFTKYTLILLFSLTNILLLTDFAIFRSWGYHINGMVLNIMFSPSAYASLEMPTSSLIFVGFVILSLFYIQFFIIKKISKIKNPHMLNTKLNRTLFILLFIIISEKLTFAVANLHLNKNILDKTKVVALYQPLLMDKELIKMGLKKATNNQLSIKIDKITNIKYPINKLSIKSKNKPNIFIFGIDALRPDTLTQDIAPNLYTFSNNSVVFNNNYSGGNNTRFGLFSLFYGINSSYWFNFLNIGRAPVLFDILNSLNYNISIISSVSTEWPEFRKTIFYSVQDKIKDDFQGSVLQKDEQTINYFSSWINQQNSDKPIFSFVWFDGVHGRAYGEENRKFLPDNDKVNDYLSATQSQKESLFNMYKNSVNSVDKKFKVFVDDLKAKGLYDDSIIIVVSDHGQEFYEHGFYGHNSAYDKEQARAVLMIKAPNKTPKKVEYMTSHLDFIPTILTQLGVTNKTSDYSHGQNLFDKNYHRECSFIGNWNENAIVCKDYTFIFSDIVTKMFDNQIRKSATYKKVDLSDKSQINKILLNTLKENRHFSK